MPKVLGPRALNRALLARQFLLKRQDRSAESTLEHLVGLQAQAPMPPYFGLWTRLNDFEHGALSRLLLERQAVRIALMRGTVHLVTARDSLRLRRPLQAAIERGLYSTPGGKALMGIDAAAVAAAARIVLEERPRTNAELGPLLAARWPDYPAEELVRLTRCMLPLVQVPPRGIWGASGQATSTTLEHWLGAPFNEDATIDDLVLRYVAAFGPASVQDAQKWSGLTRLGAAFERLRPQLCTFEGDDGRELFDVPDAPRPSPNIAAPARFLPDFDNVLLSHANREHILSEEHRARVFTINGLIRATILVDGRVAGLWQIDEHKDTATLTIEPFAPLAKRDIAALTAEGKRLLRFAAEERPHRGVRFTSPKAAKGRRAAPPKTK
ncbi:winged helix DNA-binding domain-containing protein [Pendulispora albinea]|uniref:Winged helix DNA-binding domain-containing protein n=1 Tax=Pendulispora albinea TaxID=2741071 RepID=A0ABZ2LWB0_9BACT